MQKVTILNKKEGQTPLQALEFFRSKNKEYEGVKMTYAGRLDPMASGLLIVLAGEETKNKEKYLNLNKEYLFEVLLGFKTDTYDILGKVTDKKEVSFGREEIEKILKKETKKMKGKFFQEYPIYSSKTVEGRHLFEYARNGESVSIPKKEVEIKNIKINKIKKIKGTILKKKIIKRVGLVSGDFRQKEILEIWSKNINEKSMYFISEMKVSCTSGTYVRVIANSLGEALGVGALAYSIKRTKIGKYKMPSIG